MFSRPETSPFTPGRPAPFELFVGRTPQVEALLEYAREAADGRLKVAFLTGERGIGKTSLARFARVLAERDHGLLGLHVGLGGTADARGMVHRVLERLANVAREIGDAAFRFTRRSVVSRRDAQRAVVGAANILGHKQLPSPGLRSHPEPAPPLFAANHSEGRADRTTVVLSY